jgi:hypothetical protein
LSAFRDCFGVGRGRVCGREEVHTGF